MINPEIDVIAWPEAITAQNVPEFVRECDIIVDGIDPLPGILVSKELARQCSNEGKPFLYPIDVGWGAMSLNFGFNKIKFEDVVKEGSSVEMLNNLINFITSLVQWPDHVVKIWQRFQRKEIPHYPQPITASLTAATLVTITIVKIVKEESLPLLMYFDPYSNTFMGGVT
jgi:molybdopterin/thiamine biosynthesis adenylyltransferase